MLDIDNFKNYNDQYGHQQGDDCLRAVAHAIEAVVAETNAEGMTKDAFVARYGGEEFAVVIPNASEAAYQGIAPLIVGAVQELQLPHAYNGHWGVATISAGGCRSEVSAGEVAAVFRRADAALYRAKENGRNRCELA